MATVGIKTVKLALVSKDGIIKTGTDGIFKYTDQATTDKTGIFEANQDSVYGVASLALTGLSANGTVIYGSNKETYISAGKGAPQSVLTVNDMPAEIKSAIISQESDGKGGFKISGSVDSNNYLAYIAESAESFSDDKPVYIGMYAGIAQEASVTLSTNNAAQVRNTDAITIQQIERGDDGFGKFFYSTAKGFDAEAMQSDVFKAPAGNQG